MEEPLISNPYSKIFDNTSVLYLTWKKGHKTAEENNNLWQISREGESRRQSSIFSEIGVVTTLISEDSLVSLSRKYPGEYKPRDIIKILEEATQPDLYDIGNETENEHILKDYIFAQYRNNMGIPGISLTNYIQMVRNAEMLGFTQKELREFEHEVTEDIIFDLEYNANQGYIDNLAQTNRDS
jgi:hypothetical protein